MSVEGPIVAMQRLNMDSSPGHVDPTLSVPLQVQMLSPQLRRERAQSMGDAAPLLQPTSVQPVRRAKSPLAAQVG